MKRMLYMLLAAVLLGAGTASANKINSVIAVDFLNVEVVMDEPLTKAELDPLTFDPAKSQFHFNDGVIMTGAPREKDVKGYPNTYWIPVNGMDEGMIYQISYGDQKPKTFKVYDEEDMDHRYKDRYGDYF